MLPCAMPHRWLHSDREAMLTLIKIVLTDELCKTVFLLSSFLYVHTYGEVILGLVVKPDKRDWREH